MGNYPTDAITPVGPPQMVTYAINSADGSLSTTDTATSAPLANVGDGVWDYSFNPAQDTLAVVGTAGVTLFSFTNGVLHQTSTFAITGGANELAWDNAGHLFVVGGQYGQPATFYVFNVANGVATAAPGRR